MLKGEQAQLRIQQLDPLGDTVSWNADGLIGVADPGAPALRSPPSQQQLGVLARLGGRWSHVVLAREGAREAVERAEQPSANLLTERANTAAHTVRRDGQRGPTQRFNTFASASFGVLTAS